MEKNSFIVERVSFKDLIVCDDPMQLVREALDTLRWKAHVHGWRLTHIKSMFTAPLSEDRVLTVDCEPLPPSPGYDADGRECWDYP